MESKDDHRRDLGRLGEDIACELLTGMGHTILERNYRSGHLEIDIISLDAAGIHFVEVKTRRDSIQAPPQYNVDRAKQGRITKAALGFLHSRKGLPLSSYECHFDIVAVTFSGNSYSTEWFPQAYIPIYV
jgi:putative endonuclease